MNAILMTHGAYAAAYNAEEERWLESRRRNGFAGKNRRIAPRVLGGHGIPASGRDIKN